LLAEPSVHDDGLLGDLEPTSSDDADFDPDPASDLPAFPEDSDS